MMVLEVKKESIKTYILGILLTVGKKTCTGMARELKVRHDTLQYSFKNPVQKKKEARKSLLDLAKKTFGKKPVTLIFDDSHVTKPHAQDIEGIDYSFNSCSGKPELGLQVVTALLTNGSVKIPIDMKSYFSKRLSGKFFKSKAELANELVISLSKDFNIVLVLGDGHFSTKFFLQKLHAIGQQFLMRFNRSKLVLIDGKRRQIQDMLKLQRNQRSAYTQGVIDGKKYFFYVIKLKNGNRAYFISFAYINPKKVEEKYRIRWGIELFHRTAKQSLGWKDCQMRAIEKQELHTLYVMQTYAIAELIRNQEKLKNIELALKRLREPKSSANDNSMAPLGANYLCFA